MIIWLTLFSMIVSDRIWWQAKHGSRWCHTSWCFRNQNDDTVIVTCRVWCVNALSNARLWWCHLVSVPFACGSAKKAQHKCCAYICCCWWGAWAAVATDEEVMQDANCDYLSMISSRGGKEMRSITEREKGAAFCATKQSDKSTVQYQRMRIFVYFTHNLQRIVTLNKAPI